LRFRLVANKTNWPLLTGGRYSKVIVKSGLTVIILIIQFIIFTVNNRILGKTSDSRQISLYRKQNLILRPKKYDHFGTERN
jgi:hypothetical protein